MSFDEIEFPLRVGFGSAAGIVLFVACVAFALGYRRWVMRND